MPLLVCARDAHLKIIFYGKKTKNNRSFVLTGVDDSTLGQLAFNVIMCTLNILES